MNTTPTFQDDLRRMLRNPLFLFFTYVLPFLCFFGFARAFHMGTGAGVAYFAGAALTVGIVGNGLWGARTRSTPAIPPIGMAAGWLLFLPVGAALIAIAHIRYAMPLPRDWISLVLMVTLGICAQRGLGMILSAVSNSLGGAVMATLFLYLAQLFFSGATAPSTIMPVWAQNAGEFTPAAYLVRAVQGIFFRNQTILDNLSAAAALLACAIVGGFLAVWISQRKGDERVPVATKMWVAAVLLPFLLLGGYRVRSRENLGQNIGLYRNLKRSGTFLIRGARLFIGDGKVIENGSVLVRDGIIAEIFEGPGPDPALLIAEVVEGAGKTLLPGLVDAQVQLTSPGGMARAAATLLHEGVTAARTSGDDLKDSLDLRAQIASGDTLGAQLFVSGPVFAVLEDGRKIRTPKTPEEARRQVRDLKSRGADGVSAVISPAWGNGSTLGDRMDLLLVRTVAEEARAQHLPLVTHAADALGITDAVEVGSTGIQYSSLRDALPDAVVERMKRQGTWLDASLGEEQAAAPQPAPPPAPESDSESAEVPQNLVDRDRADLLRAWKAGVPLVMGSDAGNSHVPYGSSLHHELQLWVQAGIPAPVALVAATGNGAKLLGAQNRLGAIRKGLQADLLLVDGNPLQDITATQRIALVVFMGERIDRDSLLSQ